MNIEELLCLGNKTIHKDMAKLLLGELLNINPLELNLYLKDPVNPDIITKYKDCLEKIKEGKPLQYALKNVNFYGLNFYVDERVLIPRFETEELVFNSNNYINKYFNSKIRVLDLGTGSGCIGLTLKNLNKNLNITLSDVSKEALEVASINAKNLGLEVEILESNLFSNIKSKFDVIVSNPPYIALNDEVDEIVLKNEPSLALFSKNDGLDFYFNILKICENYLNDKYMIAFEIGSSQKEKVLEIIDKYLKDVKVICKNDMAGRDRMIFIFKNIDVKD